MRSAASRALSRCLSSLYVSDMLPMSLMLLRARVAQIVLSVLGLVLVAELDHRKWGIEPMPELMVCL